MAKIYRRKYGKRMIPNAQAKRLLKGYRNRLGISKSYFGAFKIAPHMFRRFTQNVWSEAAAATISGVNNIVAANTPFVCQFRLSDLPNVTEFTALYDQFMITKVVIKFIPGRNFADVVNVAPVGAVAGARLLTVIDNDDGTSPASADELRQYATAKISNYGKVHTRVLKPACLRQMYESAISSAYTPSFNQWISTTDPTTIHYGLRGVLICNDPATAINSVTYSIEATYYFKCKNIK